MSKELQNHTRYNYNHLPVHCGFCGHQVLDRDDSTSDPSPCKHTLYIAHIEGFEYIADRVKNQLKDKGYIFDGIYNNQTQVANSVSYPGAAPGDPIIRDVNGDKKIDVNDPQIVKKFKNYFFNTSAGKQSLKNSIHPAQQNLGNIMLELGQHEVNPSSSGKWKNMFDTFEGVCH